MNATSYLWNNGAVTPTIQAFQAGTYWCEVNLNGCKFRDSLVIQAVSVAPIVNLGNDTTLCGNNNLTLNVSQLNATYLWQNGTTNASITPAASGLYWVEVKNTTGCTKRDSINIFFKPIPAFSLGMDTSLCMKDTLILGPVVTMPDSYLWNDNTTSSSIKAFQPGLYWCEIRKDVCYFRDSIVIHSIKPLPFVNLGRDTTLCEGTIINLNATYPAATYLWQDGNVNASYLVSQQGQYRVVVNLDGCISSDTINVRYSLKPRFTLGDDLTICDGNNLSLSLTPDPSWTLLWQDGSTGSNFTATGPGLYSLSATNQCGSTTDEVTISKGICTVYIPNAFTPKSDGRNDVFKILGTEAVTSFNLKIYNRYGQTVFETADRRKGWDGRLKGVDTPMGAFVYIVSYKEITSAETTTIKGSILLIR